MPDRRDATAADVVRTRLGDRPTPRAGVVLGSGLGALAAEVEDPVRIPYAELPGFPVARVAGHAGMLHVGRLGGTPVAVLEGRAHVYEGVDVRTVVAPVQMLRALGADTVVLTNAAGSLRPEVGPGSLMAIADHINLMGVNPLVGLDDPERFVSLRDAYDPGLRALLRAHAARLGIALAEGVYVAVAGPSFETPAEIRAFRTLGADAVGMSTVPEVIAARHAGLRVAAVSAITNLAEGMADAPLDHAHTLRFAERAAGDLVRLLIAIMEDLPR